MTAQETMFLPAPESKNGRTLRIALGAVVIVALVIPFGLVWMPTVLRYEIEDGQLHVKARAGFIPHNRTIDLSRVEDADLVQLSGGTRTMGTGMPGFCAGRFSYDNLGAVWQATSCVRSAVLLRVRGEERPVVLSPQDRWGFVVALRSKTSGTFAPMPSGGRPLWWTALLVLFAVIPLPILALFFVAPGRLAYRIHERTIVVRTLTRKAAFPLEDARARRYQPGRKWRTFGVGLPGYNTGWFRLDGKRTRVYASSWDGILIENGARLFVSPADKQAFLAALARAGVTVEV